MGLVEKALGALLLIVVVLLGVQTVRLSALQGIHARTTAEWTAKVKAAEVKAHQEALAESEAARETERISNRANQRIVDDLQRRQAETARALASTSRQLLDARAAYLEAASEAARATAAQCRSLDAPAVAILPDKAREDLVGLARDAEVVAARLRSCQRYINEVIGPYLWTNNP